MSRSVSFQHDEAGSELSIEAGMDGVDGATEEVPTWEKRLFGTSRFFIGGRCNFILTHYVRSTSTQPTTGASRQVLHRVYWASMTVPSTR